MAFVSKCILVIFLLCNVFAQNDDPSIVTTKYGKLQGVITGEGREFLKVPYAAAPIGDLRWREPQALEAWNGIYDATHQMPGCYQSCGSPWYLCPKIKSEDCLFMNIYTPFIDNSSAAELLPVFLFIHGGSFIHYYGGAYVGNSTTLANLTNSIACLINYRLGPFGFYYNENLNVSGNYGYLDQKAALLWIHENIESFGGDPDRIVIGGESAGAQSVTLMTTDESLDNLYIGAIVESNPVAVPYRTPQSWHEIPTAFIAACGCNIFNNDHVRELECIRSRNSSHILTAGNIAVADGAVYINNSLHDVEPWSPTIGGIDNLFEDQPQWLYRDGKFNNKVPMIMGTNRNEFDLFLYAIWNYNTTLPAWELEGFMDGLIGDENTQKAFEYYNISIIANHSQDMRSIGAQMLTDSTFRCPSRYMMKMKNKYNSNNGYFYHFNHASTFNKYAFDTIPACWNNVCHASELPYVFRIPLAPINVNASYTLDEWNLSEMFQFYWSNIGYYGKPGNGTKQNNKNSGGVEWTSFDNKNTNTMLLDVPPPPNGNGVQMVSNYDDNPCDFWDSLDYNWNY